jgi:hypothetical protein
MNNKPQFKIHGQEIRNKKSYLSKLKLFVENFWYYQRLEKDMGYCMMSDQEAQIMYDEKIVEIEKIEKELQVPFISRKDKLEHLKNL